MKMKELARRALMGAVALALAVCTFVVLPGCDTTPAIDRLAEHIEETGEAMEGEDATALSFDYVSPAGGEAESLESTFPNPTCVMYSYEDKVTLIITRHNSTGLATSVDLTSIEIPRDGDSEAALTHGGVVEAGDAQFVTSGTATIDIEARDGRNEIEFDTFESGTNSGSLGMTSSPEGEFTDNAVIDINSLLTSLDAHLEDEGLGFGIADLGFSSYQAEA